MASMKRENTFHGPSSSFNSTKSQPSPAGPTDCHGGGGHASSLSVGGAASSSLADDVAAAMRSSSTFNASVNTRTNFMLRSQYTISNLLAFSGAGQVGDKEQFKLEVVRTRKRIHALSRRTIDPRSRFVRVWDSITVCALLFTTFVTPFEVSFFVEVLGDGTYVHAPINFTCNRIVDAIFIIDIVINFFLPFRASHREGGMMVYDNLRIAKAYLRGWFALDFVTCLPLDLIVFALVRVGSMLPVV